MKFKLTSTEHRGYMKIYVNGTLHMCEKLKRFSLNSYVEKGMYHIQIREIVYSYDKREKWEAVLKEIDRYL